MVTGVVALTVDVVVTGVVTLVADSVVETATLAGIVVCVCTVLLDDVLEATELVVVGVDALVVAVFCVLSSAINASRSSTN